MNPSRPLLLVAAVAVLAAAAFAVMQEPESPPSSAAADRPAGPATTPLRDERRAPGAATTSAPGGQGRGGADLVLHGTFATANPATSSALIARNETAPAARYSVGDPLPGGGTLYAVAPRTIEVLTEAGVRTVALRESTGGDLRRGDPGGEPEITGEALMTGDVEVVTAAEARERAQRESRAFRKTAEDYKRQRRQSPFFPDPLEQ